MSSRRYTLYCALCLACFALLSIIASLHKPLWRDEVFSLFAASGSLARAFEISRGDSWGAVFYPLLHFWIKVAGTNELLLRLFPLSFALLTIAALQWRAYPLQDDTSRWSLHWSS